MSLEARVVWQPRQPKLGVENAVLVASSRTHNVNDFEGPLSIKTVVRGRVAWKVERRDIWVDDSSFLTLNNGVPYSMQIDAAEPVTTSCVFFEKGFVESVYHDVAEPLRSRLTNRNRMFGRLVLPRSCSRAASRFWRLWGVFELRLPKVPRLLT
ncbi:MAG: hypothetical protein JO051_13095 [Acidobacteriaceae bacterium]|nr:hypothetical protein [Acidobacteriaceae bacterium]